MRKKAAPQSDHGTAANTFESIIYVKVRMSVFTVKSFNQHVIFLYCGDTWHHEVPGM